MFTLPAFAEEHSDAVNCGRCQEWNQEQMPFHVYGNTWYVGTKGLSSILITSPRGHILLDGALPQSAAAIQKHIRGLGFRVEDVKLIANSHAHFDHAGGIAALQNASGAMVVASASGAQVLKNGTAGEDDPQFEPNANLSFPKVAEVQMAQEGQVIKVGDLAITAHMTPGHTPGSTTWSWQSCEKGRCLEVVYVDSLSAITAKGFAFSGNAQHPDISEKFKASIAKVAQLKCDIVLAPHPSLVDTFEKLAKKNSRNNPFIDANGCREYAEGFSKDFDAQLERERVEKANGKSN